MKNKRLKIIAVTLITVSILASVAIIENMSSKEIDPLIKIKDVVIIHDNNHLGVDLWITSGNALVYTEYDKDTPNLFIDGVFHSSRTRNANYGFSAEFMFYWNTTQSENRDYTLTLYAEDNSTQIYQILVTVENEVDNERWCI